MVWTIHAPVTRVTCRQLGRIARIECAAGHVGTFDIAPQPHELEAVVAAHDAGEQPHHCLTKTNDSGPHFEPFAAVERMAHVGVLSSQVFPAYDLSHMEVC